MKRAVLLVLGVAALCVLIALGWWQKNRLEWKEGLLAEIEANVSAPALPLDQVLGTHSFPPALEYRPASVTGTFTDTPQQFFLATYNGTSGWHVYAAFKLADGRHLIVNRGFVPFDARDDRQILPPADPLTLTGLLRLPLAEKPSWIVPDNDPAAATYYWKDLAAMRAAMGLADAPFVEVFLDLTSPGTATGLPIPGVTLIDLPNNHLQYMITWWGLALALLGVMVAYGLRTRRGRHEGGES